MVTGDASMALVVWLIADDGALYSVSLTLGELLGKAACIDQEGLGRPCEAALH
jgi:hypothetical protein